MILKENLVGDNIMKPLVVVIVGPTASGKTALSIELAKKVNGEIISADSMQIYKDMNIGTAKPAKEEMQGIKHYLIDCVSPLERYSVSEYKKAAILAIEEILEKGKVPIIVGGTGLYVDSLIYGIDFQEMEFDKLYREELEQLVSEGKLPELYEKAKFIDPEAIEKISPNDKKRILRILEIYKATGKNKTEQNKESLKNGVPFNYVVFALDWERDELYNRINKRVDLMLEQGLIEEVQNLLEKYGTEMPTAMQGLGYKEVKQFFDRELTEDEMIEKIKQETRRYAKRQLTWFRKNKETIWLDAKSGLDENLKVIFEKGGFNGK